MCPIFLKVDGSNLETAEANQAAETKNITCYLFLIHKEGEAEKFGTEIINLTVWLLITATSSCSKYLCFRDMQQLLPHGSSKL